ncbi:MAG: TatD family hydrolase [Candidatus Odinarchaeum yellowstonii]|uniref:TatD family hydrolase n=1 Tax=Odinarchaeota yellowstonii (strain LCB_4) TaxID=1841599 RepID=A0AAF0D2X3_ODILC|nr:MAG: TatD family hydrolase [Candidatus Odinarchaeum yellowstonii]
MPFYKLIDAHCHVFSNEFDDDRLNVLQKAYKTGVIGIIESALDLKTAFKVLNELKKPSTNLKIYLAVGLNPCCVTGYSFNEAYSFIEANSSDITAIGEVGLDFYLMQDSIGREKQISYFKRFISLSKEMNLPIIVHSRSAGKYAIQILVEEKAEKVLLHAFDGSFKSAKSGVENGFFFSIPPSISYSVQKQKLVEKLPLEQILLETDAPSLSPYKNIRNTPENLIISLREVAKIKKIDLTEVAETTFKNTVKLFNIRNLS